MSGLTIDDPVTLHIALISNRIIPGDTLWLRGGTYTGDFTVTFAGTVANRITIRAYPGETPVIDGSITVGDSSGDEGSYVDIRNLQVKRTITDRGEMTDPDGTMTIPTSFEILAHHVRLINNIVHDGGVGIGHWGSAYGGVVYGNVVYNNGWANVGGAGQSIYIQNQGAAKTVKHNVFGPAFKTTFSCYANDGGTENIDFLQNVILGSNGTPLIGGDSRFNTITFNDNHIKNRGLALGYTHDQNGSITLLRNRIYAPGMALVNHYFETVNLQNNILVGGGGGTNNESFEAKYPTDQTGLSWTLDNNAYHYTGAGPKAFEIDGIAWYSWAEWQALGFDANSSYSTSLPATNETFVYANEYPDDDDPRRGIVVIWNWEGLNSVNVDLSALTLANGTYRWRQAQDPLNDTGTFEYDGSAVSFAMTGHTAAIPTAWEVPLIDSQFPTFGCFVIEAA